MAKTRQQSGIDLEKVRRFQRAAKLARGPAFLRGVGSVLEILPARRLRIARRPLPALRPAPPSSDLAALERDARVAFSRLRDDTPLPCEWCEGTGFIVSTGVLCRTCGGLGVRP